jgi:hypothetical protein
MSNQKNFRARRRKKTKLPKTKKEKKKKKLGEEIDYLTNMPPEILIRIISNVPLSSYLDLTQTSNQLRYMMQNYAEVICSLAIESRFPAEARLLESIEVEGWLTPTNGLIYIQPREVPRWVDEKLQLQLYEPGPQFLYFLERNVVKFTIEDPFVAEWSDLQQFMDGLNEESPVVFGGRDYGRWVWLREMVWYYGIPW